MKNLQLSLINKWFQMTKEPDISKRKIEEYREFNSYWACRLLLGKGCNKSQKWWQEKYFNLNNAEKTRELILFVCESKPFTHNIMTLGYPKADDTSRILKLEHNGIEIRTGRSDWGAVEGKLYFVIKHGNIL